MNRQLELSVHALLKAVAFAARAHQGQLRKDGATPYASHVFRVCLILRHVFEISDESALTAALLHDALEDTTTDFDDLEEEFGEEVAGWIAALSKDSRLSFDRRETEYCRILANSPWQVQVCKLADIVDNLLDSGDFSNADRLAAVRKKKRYIDAIASNLQAKAKNAWEITIALYEEIEQQLLT